MKLPKPIRVLVIGAGSLLMLALVAVVAGYLSAPNFYLTRTIFWGESDYRDHEKFPSRIIHNAPPASTSCLQTIPTPPISRPSHATLATAKASKITLRRAGRQLS